VTVPPEYSPGDPQYWQKLFAEESVPFEPELTSSNTVDTLRGLYSSVLADYEYTCAMTGVNFGVPQEFLHDALAIAPIRPLDSGGKLHVSNFLCLENRAAHAFRAGHISVGPRLQLLVDLSRIDPELLESLNPIGRLNTPRVDVAMPDAEALAYHRAHVFLSEP
jgi:predicted restriction endonuclease